MAAPAVAAPVATVTAAAAIAAFLALPFAAPAARAAARFGPPGAESDSSIVIVAGGDVLLDRGVRGAMTAARDPLLPFRGLKPLLTGADVVLANLECPLASSCAPIPKPFSFRGDPELAPVLRQAGFTALSLANNHAYDCGREALLETAAHLEAAGILPVGAGADLEAARRGRRLTVRGIRLALLAFVDMPLEGLMPLADRPGPALWDQEASPAAVAAARGAADVVVVSLHWGGEYSPVPAPEQQRIAALLATAGADVIVGHHPHVVQPVERVGRTLVFYSLGNLVFDPLREEAAAGLLARLRFTTAGLNEASIAPTRIEAGATRPAGPLAGSADVRRLAAVSPEFSLEAAEPGWWRLTPVRAGVTR